MYFDPKAFGKRMKEARNRKGLTQERLAELLGVDRPQRRRGGVTPDEHLCSRQAPE